MFVDLDWPLNASSLLSASAELLVIWLCPTDFARAHCTTFLFFIITVYCYVVWSNGWPALMGSGLSSNPPLHINISYCMLLMCMQVVNKRSLSLSLSLSLVCVPWQRIKPQWNILCRPTVFIAHHHSSAYKARYWCSITVCPSVCPSVCLSDQRWYCVEMVVHVKPFLWSIRAIVLVFEPYWRYQIPTVIFSTGH